MLAPRRNQTEILLTIIRSPPAIYTGCRRIKANSMQGRRKSWKSANRKSTRIVPDDVKDARMEKKWRTENNLARGEKEEEREEM